MSVNLRTLKLCLYNLLYVQLNKIIATSPVLKQSPGQEHLEL